MRRLIGAMLDFAYPRFCLHCNNLVGKDSAFYYLCSNCSKNIYLNRPPFCNYCGKNSNLRVCQDCDGRKIYFQTCKSIFLMREAGSSLVYTLKYKNGNYLKKDLCLFLKKRDDLKEFFNNAILVPVPLHKKRLRKRGFNQSEWLAKWSAKSYNASVQNLLIRHVNTPSQTSLNKVSRKNNVKNAFSLSKKYSIKLNKRYIVVDDVLTTGSTINECASVLKNFGAKCVDAFVLAHG